jgi:hypothetical protein
MLNVTWLTLKVKERESLVPIDDRLQVNLQVSLLFIGKYQIYVVFMSIYKACKCNTCIGYVSLTQGSLPATARSVANPDCCFCAFSGQKATQDSFVDMKDENA